MNQPKVNMLPTADLDFFLKQIDNVNTDMRMEVQQNKRITQVKKNLIVSYVSDASGCGHIRNVFPMTYINACFGKSGELVPVIAPFYLYQHDILVRTRALWFQRQMNEENIAKVAQYKEMQQKYRYKMLWEIDDFIWKGPDKGESIPEYNFASVKLPESIRQASIKIANMMDTVVVSTEFLKEYMSTHGVTVPIVVIPNAVMKAFWGGLPKRRPIKERLKKPRVICTDSPTHYCNQRKLLGDWDNAWREWVIKNVMDNKIEFLIMGGVPFFFEGIKNKSNFHHIDWINSYQFHVPFQRFRPDIGLAPLVYNHFNMAKSDLKLIEYSAAGCVACGTTWSPKPLLKWQQDNNMSDFQPSPYDDLPVHSHMRFPDDITLEQLEENMNRLYEPEIFNDVISQQYRKLEQEGRWLEDSKWLNKMLELF
jgi:hypothetical protein